METREAELRELLTYVAARLNCSYTHQSDTCDFLSRNDTNACIHCFLRRKILKYLESKKQETKKQKEKLNPSKHHGKVKWFNDAKGFGFITDSKTNQDIFVYFTSILSEGFRSLTEGDTVEFDVIEGPKGLTSSNVRKI